MDHAPTLDKMNDDGGGFFFFFIFSQFSTTFLPPVWNVVPRSDSGFIKPRLAWKFSPVNLTPGAGVLSAKSDLWTSLLENVIDAGDEVAFRTAHGFLQFGGTLSGCWDIDSSLCGRFWEIERDKKLSSIIFFVFRKECCRFNENSWMIYIDLKLRKYWKYYFICPNTR